jgi:hypothetical protein
VIRVFGALLTMLVLASVCGCGTEEAESLQSRAGADEAVVAEPEGAADDRASVVTVGPFRPLSATVAASNQSLSMGLSRE